MFKQENWFEWKLKKHIGKIEKKEGKNKKKLGKKTKNSYKSANTLVCMHTLTLIEHKRMPIVSSFS